MEKCIQLRLIQTEYTACIAEYKTLFGHSSVTIGPVCIQSDSPAPDGTGFNRNYPRKPLSPVGGKNARTARQGEKEHIMHFPGTVIGPEGESEVDYELER